MAAHVSDVGGTGHVLVGGNSNLKVQAQKRRELEAKQLLPQPTKARPLFGPPIQVNRTNDPTHTKLSDLFGRYDDAKELVASNTHYGAVLQPPTPHPQTPSSPLPGGGLTSGGIRSKPEVGDRHHLLLSSAAEADRQGMFERFKRKEQANAADAIKSSDRTSTKTASVASPMVVAADVSRIEGASSRATVDASPRKHGVGGNDVRNKDSPLATASGRTFPSSVSGHERHRHQNRNSDDVSRSVGHQSHKDRPIAAPSKENKATSSNNKPVASKSSISAEVSQSGSGKVVAASTPTKLEKSSAQSSQTASSVKSSAVGLGLNPTAKLSLHGMRDSQPVAKLETPGKLKLTIPSPKDHGQFEDFVSDLLKEVSVPPPLTAIRSPRNDDSAGTFSFRISSNSATFQDSQAVAIPTQARSHSVVNGTSDSGHMVHLPPQRCSPLIHPDLILSEDEEDGAPAQQQHLDAIDNDIIPPSNDARSPMTKQPPTHTKLLQQGPPGNKVMDRVKAGRVQPTKQARHRSANERAAAESPPHHHLRQDEKNIHVSRLQSSASSSHSTLPEAAVVIRPKAETFHERVGRKQSTTAASTSSESETSDDSDEESDSNSSDEESSELSAQRTLSATDVRGVQPGGAVDVDVDKQNTSNWGLLNFIRPGKSQVPSCMTAPEPVPVAAIAAVQASAAHDIYPDSVEDLENLCSSLLFDDQPVLSPLPVDRSAMLDSMSHDMDDVFDSVMKGDSDELPPLADLTSQLAFVSHAPDEAGYLLNMPSTPPVLPVIPPALTFANGRPSVVVKLRRIPSRKYPSNSDKALHMNPVVKLERVPSTVSPLRLDPAQPELERTKDLTSSSANELASNQSKTAPYVKSPSKVTVEKCSKSSSLRSPELKINAPRGGVSDSPLKNGSTKGSVSQSPLKNGSMKSSTVSQSPHKSDLKKKLSDCLLDSSSSRTKVPLTDGKVESSKRQDIIDGSVAKQRKIQHKDDKRPSSETSKSEMRHKTEKRKSDFIVDGVSDAKLICDNGRRAVNGLTEMVNDKRSISTSRSTVSNNNSEAGGGVFSEVQAEDQPVLLPVAPMLTPPPSVVNNSYATDGSLSSSSSESQPRRPAKYDKTSAAVPSSTRNNFVQDQIDGATNLQLKAESERTLCNDVLDMKKASMTPDTMFKSSTDNMESMCKDKRLVDTGNISKPLDRRKDVPWNVRIENDKLTSNCYLEMGQKLKHQGDATIERIERMLIYLESVLMFIRHGEALESEGRSLSVLYANRKETLRFCQSVCDLHYFNRSNSDINRSKLTVLGLRLLSFIHHKLYNLKKFELRSLRRTVDESLQNPSLKPLQVPSPYNGQGSATPAALNDTLSPLSSHLTPSPAGSVSSVGSAGSQGNDHCSVQRPAMTNSLSKFVAVPQQVYSNMLGYVGFVGHLHDCHEHWDQADALTASNPALVEFFASIDSQCERLHLGSHMSMISQYCYKVFDSFRPVRS